MTSRGPEPDPYADVYPAVPGWTSAGQDFYTGPLYDDTGWHIDLSDVDWGRKGDSDQAAAPAAFRYERNVVKPRPVAFGRSADLPATEAPPASLPPAERRPGRHARHARPDEDVLDRPPPAGPRPAGTRRAPDPGRLNGGTADPRTLDRGTPGRSAARDGTARHGAGVADYSSREYAPADQGRAGQAPAAAGATSGTASVVSSSGVMAIGTLGSRLTGFLRTIVQAPVLGLAGIGQVYNLSNTLPNVVYNLALGGILTSVIVPLIVAAAARDRGRGRDYDQRMFTLITLALAGITLVAELLAVPIVHLYSGSSISGDPAELHLAVIFALFFIPQIFFYGLSSLIGAILNSRGSFAAPMWTPIVNNFVVIGILGLYAALAGLSKTPGTISGADVTLLGFGTTLGILAQTAALVPALRRVGFRWRPRLDFRRAEVAEIGRMGGWMFGYIAATQVAFLVTTKIAGDTSSGVSVYNYAWLLFQLPYAVVGISVITALLPRMSTHAAAGEYRLVKNDFSAGLRLAATIVVPCSLVLAVLGPSLGEVFFGHGRIGTGGARYTGVVFAVFCLGLLPYMIFQLQLRVFYSMHDSKTPAMIGAVTMTVNILANVIALHVAAKSDLVAALGIGFGLSNVTGLVLAWRILSVRMRGLDGWLIGRSLVRMHAATIPAALIVIMVASITANAYVDVVIGGGLALGMYLIFARVLRIDELTGLARALRARVGR
jgi:putative peptidoglycan lipid II flippase